MSIKAIKRTVKRTVKPKVPLETDEQKTFVQYLRLRGIKHSKLAQETYTKSYRQKAKNKAEGLVPGIPDMLLIIENHLIFIEMKRKKGSSLSDSQRQWIKDLNNCNGVGAFVCYGAEEAIHTVEYLLTKTDLKLFTS
jgi:hypothetical protein